jgi:adenylosuccinate synthase
MPCTCVVGLQWGDEAKGKVVDLLTGDHDLVVRFNGGANAGHTVVVGDQKYKLSLVPSGIVHERLACVIGNGLAIHPKTLLAEIDSLSGRGLEVAGRLWISDRAHVVMPYHLEEERVLEESSNGHPIGTTRRGVGPCYADKAARTHSLRMSELVDPKLLRERLAAILPYKNRVLAALAADAVPFDLEAVAREHDEYGDRLRPFVGDVFWRLQRALAEGKRILFEAAQGTLLDVDHGTYPYVTSSNSSLCGLAAGCGVPQRAVDEVIGIAKSYTTRVGEGPFPTELCDEIGALIRDEGKEYGTVTGRPRRCGWFDAVACRYTARINGIDCVALMSLDVLSKLDEVKICEAYEIDGERTDEFQPCVLRLAKCKPVLRTMKGWKREIRPCRSAAELPAEARAYIDAVTELLGVPARLCSVGPARDETIFLEPGQR